MLPGVVPVSACESLYRGRPKVLIEDADGPPVMGLNDYQTVVTWLSQVRLLLPNGI